VTVQLKPMNGGASAQVDAMLTAQVGSSPVTPVNLIGRRIGSGGVLLSPSGATFADTVVGQQSAAATFSVQNTNSVAETLGALVATTNGGTTADANFAIVGGTCGATLAAGASCTITVRFTPGSVGPHAAYLRLASATGQPYAQLTGTGLAPANIAVSSTLLSFGNVAVGANKSLDVTLTNSGGVASSAITTSALSGIDSTQYTITANACTGTLAAGASCTITVQFHPATVGSKSASFTVGATSGLPTTTINLNGTGVTQATLGMSPSTVQNAGSRAVGAIDPTGIDFTITNGGAVPSGDLTISLSNSVDFAIGAGTTCTAGAPLAAGASCTVNVRFNPANLGARTTMLSVGGLPGGTVSNTINGTGLSALSSTSPVSVTASFGSSGTVVLTFTNDADVATGVLTTAIGGSGASQFSIVDDQCTLATLAAHASCTVEVAWVPAANANASATVTVSGTPGNSATVTVNGMIAP
jgi:hypothetical protein